ncbi:MAG TPA: hypothetical protein VGQ50_10860 [Actinomycetota bacterium]|jgi:hypothetical protein|nr:hypothetical protein [Actinomycetota bacterium]
MPHADHEPGTREDCDDCRALAYEPGWYKALRDERVLGKDPSVVAVPEPDEEDVEIVVSETPAEDARRRR